MKRKYFAPFLYLITVTRGTFCTKFSLFKRSEKYAKQPSFNGNEEYPKLRFKDFTNPWKEVNIGDILKIKHGKDYKKENNNQKLYPVLGTGGIITYIDNYLCDWDCVCIGRKGTINKPIFMNTPFWSVDTLFYSKPTFGNNPKFQFYLFETINWLSYNAATGLPSLSASIIESIKRYVPSINEQQKIADFLSLIDKRIEKQRQLVESLKKYKRGLLSAIFARKIKFLNNEIWVEKKLKDVCNGFDNQRKPISAELREKGQVPYYGANGIQDYVKDYIFDGKYVLLAEDGGHFDEFSTMPIAQFIEGRAWVNNHAHILQGKKDYNTKFIYYSLVHKDIRKYINGTSRAKLNQEDMWKIKIVIPSKELQTQIAEYFSNFDIGIKAQEKCIQKLEYLKKGLLQQMFI